MWDDGVLRATLPVIVEFNKWLVSDATLQIILVAKLTPGFFQHGGVSIETAIRWITEVCCKDNHRAAGPALDRKSQDDVLPGSYVILRYSYSGTWWFSRNSHFFRVLLAYSDETEVGPVSVSLTLDTPRIRAHSVNYTHTSRVRSVSLLSQRNFLTI